MDHLLRTGDRIDWDEKGSESGAAGMAETPMSEPSYERQLDHIATLRLPERIEEIVKGHVKNIATSRKGRHMWTKIEEGCLPNERESTQRCRDQRVPYLHSQM
eukprot:5512018-Amphidinium_carterae.1